MVLRKICAPSVCIQVIDLFNKILSTSDIPQEWNTHAIIPMYKKGNKLNVANYRPISLLCILEKVLETLEVIPFLQPQLSRNHFRFSKSSYVMNLLNSYADIYNAINHGHSADVVFLDFQKAFDSVPHNELLIKLWRLGITMGIIQELPY